MDASHQKTYHLSSQFKTNIHDIGMTVLYEYIN